MWLWSGERGKAVLKFGAAPAERAFHEEAAPALQAHGAGIPRLLALSRRWIALEYIPRSLAWDRSGVGRSAVAMLARLHRATWGRLPRLSVPWTRFRWEPGWLPGFSGAAAEIFAPLCLVSGDANPTNWRLREDGSAVLVDWGRVGAGHPCLDLATCLPGLPDRAEIEAIAKMYLQLRPDLADWRASALSRLIWLARLWTFLDFLAAVRRGRLPAAARPGVAMLERGLGAWLEGGAPPERLARQAHSAAGP